MAQKPVVEIKNLDVDYGYGPGAVRAVRLLARKPASVAGLDVMRISPRTPLGSIRDALTWSPENVRRWIQQGEDDAAASVE